MSISDLTLIGESINDSVPSTHLLFENNDIDAVIKLAKYQVERGVSYIDVNVGLRTSEFIANVIRKLQENIAVPLSIDTPDPDIASAALNEYKPEKAGNRKPILNSITLSRLEMFDLYSIQPFIPLLLIAEGKDSDGNMKMNKTPEETFETAKQIIKIARDKINDITNDQIILDPGITPIGSDTDGNLKRLINSLKLIHNDRDFNGINISVGLSNFTVMLPSKNGDGLPVKEPLENAFLTLAIPYGLNMIIGSVRRNYSILKEDDPAMQCLKDVLNLDGYDAIMRIVNFYE